MLARTQRVLMENFSHASHRVLIKRHSLRKLAQIIYKHLSRVIHLLMDFCTLRCQEWLAVSFCDIFLAKLFGKRWREVIHVVLFKKLFKQCNTFSDKPTRIQPTVLMSSHYALSSPCFVAQLHSRTPTYTRITHRQTSTYTHDRQPPPAPVTLYRWHRTCRACSAHLSLG